MLAAQRRIILEMTDNQQSVSIRQWVELNSSAMTTYGLLACNLKSKEFNCLTEMAQRANPPAAICLLRQSASQDVESHIGTRAHTRTATVLTHEYLEAVNPGSEMVGRYTVTRRYSPTYHF